MRSSDTAGVRALRIASPVLFGACALGAWQIVCSVGQIPSYLLPTPVEIARTLVRDWGLLSHALLITLEITALSFACALVIGTSLAFLFVQSRVVEATLFPYAVLLQVTPIIAIAPLVIIWVKNILASLVICATMVALFPIVSNTTLGLRSVNPSLLNLFRLHRASRWQVLVKLRIPGALPYFFGGVRISSGLSLIGAVAAEFVAGTGGSSSGLAYQILQAGLQLEIPRMFAALFLIVMAGVLLFAAMVWLSRAVLGRWHESEL